jgi:hypothetical protein
MYFLTRLLPSFLISWLLCFSFASLFHSLYVVNQLVDVGIAVKLTERLSFMRDDWLGLLPTYGVILAIALTLAFLITSLLVKKLKRSSSSTLLFTSAGIVALATVLIAIESIMNINIIAGARGWGFYLQLLAGGIGGWVFAKLVKLLSA